MIWRSYAADQFFHNFDHMKIPWCFLRSVGFRQQIFLNNIIRELNAIANFLSAVGQRRSHDIDFQWLSHYNVQNIADGLRPQLKHLLTNLAKKAGWKLLIIG